MPAVVMVSPDIVRASDDMLVILIGVVDIVVLMVLEIGDMVALLVVDGSVNSTIRMRNSREINTLR